MVELSPQYSNDSQTVFIAGSSSGSPAIWKSSDNGQTFTCRAALDPDTGATLTIDTWAVVDDSTLLIGSYDGTNGLAYHTTNSGFSYSKGALAGSQPLNVIALSPSYKEDETILVGNTSGWVYWSDDNGASFGPLPPDATSSPLTGSVTVAFDPKFDSNKTVYAASNTADKGVYRFIIGTSSEWDSIDSTLPTGGVLNQLILSTDGVLYAANSKAGDGMERCLNPTYSLGPTFEAINRGLNDNATLSGLWQHHHRLWSTDTTNIRLMTFTDSLTSPVSLTSPSDTASGIGALINHAINNVSLDWEAMGGATSYKWQLDHDTDFSTVPSGFEGDTKASSARLPTLEPTTTYYWRVRATAPALSPWSEKRAFITSLDTEAIELEPENPKAGAEGVSIKPLLQWNAIAGADAYELLVSTEVSFALPSTSKVGDYSLPTTAWQCNVSLDYETTYYWKIRAVSSDTYSAWSTVSAFTTESPPPPPPTQPEPPAEIMPEPPAAATSTPTLTMPTPAAFPNPFSATPPELTPASPPFPAPQPSPPAPTPAQFPIPPNWVIYLIGALLLTVILALVIVLMLVVGIRRL